MPGARCTRGLVCNSAQKNAHEHTGTDGTLRHSLRNGFTAYAALSPATNSSCHRRWRIEADRTRLGLTTLRQLDTSNGCQDHTVLPYAAVYAKGFDAFRYPSRRSFSEGDQRRSSCAPCHSRIRPAISRATLPRPPRPVPTFVTMANAPLSGTGWPDFTFDLPDGLSGIFLREGLDRTFDLICPSGSFGRFATALGRESRIKLICERPLGCAFRTELRHCGTSEKYPKQSFTGADLRTSCLKYPGRADMLCPSPNRRIVPNSRMLLPSSFDQLVRCDENGLRYGKAKCLCGLHVDDHFEPCRTQNRKVIRLGTAQNLAGIYTDLTVSIGEARAIAH